MSHLKRLGSLSIVLLLSAGSSAFQTHSQRSRTTDRQIGANLQRLEASTVKFRKSLNLSLLRSRIDQTGAGNDINTFETGFEHSTYQLRSQFDGRRALVADVESVLRQALLIDGFMTRNRLNIQTQNDWRAVKTNLDVLAALYDLKWSWNTSISPSTNSSGSLQLSDADIEKLIQKLEIGGDQFRTSLSEAFSETPYDRTMAEGNMNDALRGLKKSTVQLRNQFDIRHSLADSVGQVLDRAIPIDTFMRRNLLTNRAQSDWSTLRIDLTTLAGAYNLVINWKIVTSTQIGPRLTGQIIGAERGLTGQENLNVLRRHWDGTWQIVA
jgi:hypothetical protein